MSDSGSGYRSTRGSTDQGGNVCRGRSNTLLLLLALLLTVSAAAVEEEEVVAAAAGVDNILPVVFAVHIAE